MSSTVIATLPTLLAALAGVTIVVGGILFLRLHAVLALSLAALAVMTLSPNGSGQAPDAIAPGARVAQAAGQTVGKIGLVITFAAVIGTALHRSGAAGRIAGTVLRLFGARRAALGLAGSSFLLGIPVFFDTLFLLLVPLARALGRRTGRDYLLYILAIVAGGTMAHALVPPTPGPLFVAEALGVDVLTMTIAGLVVGGFAAAAGLLHAHALNRRLVIPLRQTDQAQHTDEEVPARPLPLGLALAPIAVPILLIALATTMGAKPSPAFTWSWYIFIAGDKSTALAIGALLALLLVRRQHGGAASADTVAQAMKSAGVVVLITAAGGAFGESLRQTGLASLVTATTGPSFWLLPVAFLLTTVVRTAQGSATVAMMTSVAIVAPLAGDAGLPFHPVYLALAVGCGAKNFAWMNDSGFWVMSRMSGMTERETLRTVSVMNVVMGCAGLFAVLLGAWLLPLR